MQSGGFLTANTNDPERFLKRLSRDLQQYYKVVYVSSLGWNDTSYRKLHIEVDRERVAVQIRDGYFPVPPLSPGEAQEAEAAVLAVLQRQEAPKDFPLSSRAFHFDVRDGSLRQVVAASVPVASLQFEVDNTAQRYSARLSMLARVKDASGNVVASLPKDYPLEGALSDLEELKKGDVVFLRTIDLAPGRYHLEIAAYDHGADKASAKRQVLVAPAPGAGIRLSSLILVDSLEPLSDVERMLDSPLTTTLGSPRHSPSQLRS